MNKEINNTIDLGLDLGKETRYLINVPGGVIGWDLENATENINRLKKMYDIFEEADKTYNQQEFLNDKKDNTKKDKYGLTEQEKARMKSYDNFIKSSREAIDTFFGEGATDKIFYDSQLDRVILTYGRIEMFMLEALPPHFEKSGVKADQYLKDRLKKRGRFVNKNKDVIDLDEEQA